MNEFTLLHMFFTILIICSTNFIFILYITLFQNLLVRWHYKHTSFIYTNEDVRQITFTFNPFRPHDAFMHHRRHASWCFNASPITGHMMHESIMRGVQVQSAISRLFLQVRLWNLLTTLSWCEALSLCHQLQTIKVYGQIIT